MNNSPQPMAKYMHTNPYFYKPSKKPAMSSRWHVYAAALAVFVSLSTANAFPGATVPWTTYEAEAMTINGGAGLWPPPRAVGKNITTTNTCAGESCGRQCVKTSGTAQYL